MINLGRRPVDGCCHSNMQSADDHYSEIGMVIRYFPIKSFLNKNVKHTFIRVRRYCSDNFKTKWKVMFFGTDGFALKSLEELHNAMLKGRVVSELSVVVPAPKPHPCMVAKYAIKHNLPISVWPLPKELPSQGSWDVGVVASFGHLIPSRVIGAFPLGMLNIHASLLPRWRGAAPIIHAIMHGDTETGVTIMRIKPHRFDVGDVVCQQRVKVDEHETAVQLTNRLAEMGASLLVDCLSDLHPYLDRCVPQPAEGVTLAPKIDSQLSRIDWNSMTAAQIYNRWRALRHLFKLQTSFRGENVKLNEIEPPSTVPPPPPVMSSNLVERPGRIVVDRQRNLIFVRCQDWWVAIRLVTPHRRPVMSAIDFFNGYLQKRPAEEHYFSSEGDQH
nr:EOG090X0BM2 [Scapholeberis mucronata]